MSEKQMEKNLDYGDSNNLFYFFSDIFKSFIDIDKKD